MKKTTLPGELYLLLATLLAAIGWIASKLVILEVQGPVFIAGRFLLASFILLPFCYKRILALPVRQLAATCSVGVMLALSLQIWVYAVSIANTLAEGAFIMSLAMIIAPLTSMILFRVMPHRAFWFALPIAVLGMLLLTLSNSWQVEASQWFFLLASATLSLHFVLNKRVMKRIDPLTSICLQLLVVGLSGVLATGFIELQPINFSYHLLFWFAVSTIVATAIRYLAQTMGQFKVKMETASLIMILEPIWTLLLSMQLLGESLSLQKMLGGAVIFIALFVYIKFSK